MAIEHTGRRWAGALIAVALGLILTGCVLTAGKFTSALDLRRNGTFTYSYNGEIFLLGLSKLAEMGGKSSSADEEFSPSVCYADDDELKERECTAEELAAQKSAWELEAKASVDREKKEQEAMRAMLGGLDPADPKAAEELAARLRKQAGWRSVEYKGDGLFVVDFAITGRLDHDFVFPTVERLPQANAFVTLVRRNDGTVRIDAPGFTAGTGGDPFRTMMRMAAMEGEQKDVPKVPELAGTFTIITDAEILANNTEDGPVAMTAGKQLKWDVNLRTPQAPTALVKIAP